MGDARTTSEPSNASPDVNHDNFSCEVFDDATTGALTLSVNGKTYAFSRKVADELRSAKNQYANDPARTAVFWRAVALVLALTVKPDGAKG